MIPPTVSHDLRSPGEQDMFLRLKQDPGCDNWIVLHSLDIANHVRQVQGEADFVVIVPGQGVLCLEVKAHHQIRIEEGQWFFGPEQKPGRSPFRQAAEAMHSVRKRILDRRPDLSGVVFWSAVIFTHAPFTGQSIEWHSWQVINSHRYRARPISSLLGGVLQSAHRFLQEHTPAWYQTGTHRPALEECEAIAQILRPGFEILESPRERMSRLYREVRHFTEEQFTALEAMEANQRVVFTGPAGTGKTVLALEAARRASNIGQRVLLVCFNRLLGQHLIQEIDSLPEVVVSTLHAHMLKVARMAVPPDVAPNFWQDVLPEQASEQLVADAATDPSFDVLIVDEAQDLLRENYLDFLDLSLTGGLAAGNWRFFGDFERQAIYGSASMPLETFLARRGGRAARYSLRVNCRNTAQIATLAELVSQLEPGYKRVLRGREGLEPQIHNYSTLQAQVRLLVEELEHLYSEGFTADEIVVLSVRKDSEAVASHVNIHPWQQRLRPVENRTKGHIGYCSIRAFKGLEAPVVVLTDVDRVRDEESVAVLYVGLTRALHRLTVLLHQAARKDLVDIIAGGGQRRG